MSAATEPTAAQMAVYEKLVKDHLSRSPFLNIGAYMFGFSLALILYGILVQGLAQWLSNTRSEKRHVKIILGWSFFTMTATTIFLLYMIFDLFVYNFGTYINFIGVRYMSIYTVLDVATILPVQIFFADRAYNLMHRKKWPLVFIGLGMAGELVGAVGATTRAQSMQSWAEFPLLKTWFYLWIVSTVFVDAFITGCITYSLYKVRTGWTHTDQVILKLIRGAVECQLPSTLSAVAMMLNYAFNGDHLFVVSWEIWRPPLVLVMMVCSLNNRDAIQRQLTDRMGSSIPENTFRLKTSRLQQATQLDQIQVLTETYEQSFADVPLRTGLNRQGRGSGKDFVEGDEELGLAGQQVDYLAQPSQSSLQVEVK